MPLRYSRRTVSNAVHELSPWISHLTCPPGYTPFTPSKSGQRLPPTYYRGCWHVVSRGLFVRYRLLLVPDKKKFTTRKPSSFTRRCWVRLAPIAQYSPLLPPRRSLGRISVPMWPFNPLSPATDRRLGGPLPHQLANQTRGHLSAINLLTSGPCDPNVSCGISSRFQLLSPSERQVPHALLTRPPLSSASIDESSFRRFSFDLHV